MSETACFADELLWRMLALSPETAAELGVSAVGARALPQDAIADWSDTASAARDGLMADSAAAFSRLAPPAVGEDAVTGLVLRYLLGDGLFGALRGRAGHDFIDNPYPVNHLWGYHPTMLMMLARDHVVLTVEDAQIYIARLAKLPAGCAGVIDALLSRAARGVVAPRFTLEAALADMKAFIAPAPDQNDLVQSFARKLEGAALASPLRSGFLASAVRLVEGEILPAYRRLMSAVEDQLALASEARGYWALPDGDAYYAWLLKAQTTTDLTSDAVHRLGLDGIADLHDEIRRRFAALGLAGDDIGALYAAIEAEPRWRYPESDAGRTALWSDAVRLMRGYERSAEALFHTLPQGSLEMVPVPVGLEESMHTHYTPPSANGARPGRFSLNLKSARASPRWELPTLCAHEGVPGHHLQLALAQELPALCEFRRTVVFNAYIEGWAKYAETVPESHGWLDDPYAALGRLRAELYSTVNLALDTGIHALRWTRDQAREFFQRNTGVSTLFASAIANRSFVTPGQLCSYKIGMSAMLAARDRFRSARGARYDIRDFHACVLGHGALPLRVLDGVLTAALARPHSSSSASERPS